MKASFIWLIVAGFIVGLLVLAFNLYVDAVGVGQAIEDRTK